MTSQGAREEHEVGGQKQEEAAASKQHESEKQHEGTKYTLSRGHLGFGTVLGPPIKPSMPRRVLVRTSGWNGPFIIGDAQMK